MVSEEELMKACSILSEFCNDGSMCNICIFESVCMDWDNGRLENISQVMNECKSNLIINKYRGKLYEALYALDAVCSCFTNCGECIFSRVDTCPKVAVNTTLNLINEKGVVCTTQ